MRTLFTLGMVIDLDPEEIPGFAAAIEHGGISSMYEGMISALAGRDVTEEEAALLKEKFQIFGVSYSVQHELEIPSEAP